MSNISFAASLQTCKVDQSQAGRFQSDRFLNPNVAVCPVWSGYDTAGRPACADSFYTKRAGCNWAIDRVSVENGLRPQYSDYITLDAQGIRGPSYDSFSTWQAVNAARQIKSMDKVAGNFGQQRRAELNPNCGNAYENAMAQQKGRQNQATNLGHMSYANRSCSGH